MSLLRISFDESGYTGFNLRDVNQPIFALASTTLSDQDANDILESCFPKYQAPEFKASNIWRAATARKKIPEFMDAILARSDQFFVWATNKQYLTFNKLVDSLAEPVFHSNGYDFYKNAWGRKYCNHFYAACLSIEGPEFVNSICRQYFSFSDAPTKKSLLDLVAVLKLKLNSCSEPLKPFMETIVAGAEGFQEHSSLSSHKNSNEFQFTAMLVSVAHWRRRRPEDFHIQHDVMSDFFRRRESWEKITATNVPQQVLDTADGLGVQFPLRVVQTSSVDSKLSRAIQIADVLAGVVTKMLDQNARNEHSQLFEKIFRGGDLDLNFDGVLPQDERLEGPPSRLVGKDMVDQFNGILFG
ncbi:MAG: DUF3800 domain-containing protein [Sulfitobacter sp.]